MKDSIGFLTSIYQYPVKSLKGQCIPTAVIEKYGLYGDRSHAFIDLKRKGAFLTAREAPVLTGYTATLDGEKKDNQFPNVTITSPSGERFTWDDPSLLKEIENISKRRISRVRYTPNDDLLAVDDHHIHIISLSSIRKMEELYGKEIDIQRFRANFILSLNNDAPFIEETWIGKKLKIGDIELEVKEPCRRCNMINIDSLTLRFDHSLLKTVVKSRNSNFGIYASVVSKGSVKVGDTVFLN